MTDNDRQEFDAIAARPDMADLRDTGPTKRARTVASLLVLAAVIQATVGFLQWANTGHAEWALGGVFGFLIAILGAGIVGRPRS